MTMCRHLAPWNGIMCKNLRTLDGELSHTITFVTLRMAIAISRPKLPPASQLAAPPSGRICI
jgi:hypothetical protein